MIIVDSCGWLEWFSNGKLADAYEKYLMDRENILVPAIILFEVYKVLKRSPPPFTRLRNCCLRHDAG